jgi:exodeoxyribonuclease VII small subunit
MKTFKEAYEVLSRNAQVLRDQNEPNIDDLLRIVTESVEAYKVCQERIAAVDAALQTALKDTGEVAAVAPRASPAQRPVAAPPQAAQAPRPSTGFEDMDDDIPF